MRFVTSDGKNAHSGNAFYIRKSDENEFLSRLRDAREFMINLGVEV